MPTLHTFVQGSHLVQVWYRARDGAGLFCAVDLDRYTFGRDYTHEMTDVFVFHVPLPKDVIVARFGVGHINRREDLKRILLTASGGPFLNMPKEQLESVTPTQALAHPNWSMGPKITIDSATLMNKGLEVIEAKWLFDVPVEKIDVHIHPQSIVHSMVEYVDGSVIAQMGIPDMRIPIAYALAYPERLELDLPRLDFFTVQTLTFQEPDLNRFPCLKLAFAACKEGGTMPAVLNAANEVAVQAFLDNRIPFGGIARLVNQAMEEHALDPGAELEAILEADAWARRRTEEEIPNL